jgi:hypothetical protein
VAKFTYGHLTYELPDDVNVIVYEVDFAYGRPVTDYDFYRNGEIICWVDYETNGIRKIDNVKYEDLT